MDIWSSVTYRNSIKRSLDMIDTQPLQGKSILITGASGLIGSAIVDLLICSNLILNTNLTIYAAGRSVNKISERFAHGLDYGIIPVEYDATKDISFDFAVDYIIHGASNASPDKYVTEPVDTMLANILGVSNLLKYAKKCGARKTVYISSSEVYGIITHGKPLREDEYGKVDILGNRASYPMGKRAAESICISYANQYGLDVSIVRPGHIYGPTAQKSDKRISSDFAYRAAAGESLVMKSAGTQIRSYCHCIDCATAILAVLLKGKCKEAYNISNPDSVITIRQMAEIIADCAGVELIMDLPSNADKIAFNPMNNSSLDSKKLEQLGWSGMRNPRQGFSEVIQILKEVNAYAFNVIRKNRSELLKDSGN